MWVYWQYEVLLDEEDEPVMRWAVGWVSPDGTWHTQERYQSQSDAKRAVHYLNGGE